MNTIIATTDFSSVSDNSTSYACQLATLMGAEIVLLHAFIIPIAFTSDTTLPILPMDEGKDIAERGMADSLARLQLAYPALRITPKILYGELEDCLEELAEDIKPQLIVMGNSSDEDTPGWLGSNLVHALRHLSVSVIGVPAGYAYKKVNKICLACDVAHVEEDLPLNHLSDLVQLTGANLIVLVIEAEKRNVENELPTQHLHIHNWLAPLSPEFHYITDTDINKGIEDFVKGNDIDWLIVTPHKYSFLEGLFHKSHTKEMVKHVHIPVLAMHKA